MVDKATTLITTCSFCKPLLDSLFDAVFAVDMQGVIIYWNPSCHRITGYSAEEMAAKHYHDTPLSWCDEDGNDVRGNSQHHIESIIINGMPGIWKGFLKCRNGRIIPVKSKISPIQDENNVVIGATIIFRDISALAALEKAHRNLLDQASLDQLTQMKNRAALTDLLDGEISRSRRYHQDLSVVMVDIDLFKRINDRYGHDAGDVVLREFSRVLRDNLRQPDAVGRWGGEEFMIVAPGSNARAALGLAERLRRLIHAIPSDNVSESITASFGIAQFHAVDTRDKMLFRADEALYHAKKTGRDRSVNSETLPCEILAQTAIENDNQ